jgi:hypothetical protein
VTKPPRNSGAIATASPAATAAHEADRQEDEQRRRDDDRQAQQPRLLAQAEQRGGQQRDQRRLVGVAERRVAAADDEVQLVAEDVVAVRQREVQHEGRQGDRERDRIAVPRTFHRAIFARPVLRRNAAGTDGPQPGISGR